MATGGSAAPRLSPSGGQSCDSAGISLPVTKLSSDILPNYDLLPRAAQNDVVLNMTFLRPARSIIAPISSRENRFSSLLPERSSGTQGDRRNCNRDAAETGCGGLVCFIDANGLQRRVPNRQTRRRPFCQCLPSLAVDKTLKP